MKCSAYIALLLCLPGILLAGCSTGSAPADAPRFNADRAFTLLTKQTDFGPRPIGTEAHTKTRDFLLAEMKKVTDKAERQDFTFTDNGKDYELSNIIGVINPAASRKALLAAHWDTRPIADQDMDPANLDKPILGANDGASGVAALLETARILKELKPRLQVIFVLFDGEDYGKTLDKMFLGSRHFAAHMGDYKPDYGILIDMVGDKNLNIYKEGNSVNAAPEIVEKVWNTARSLNYGTYFKPTVKYTISDDHIPLIEKGVKMIDIIDFDYAYWHTLEDTPDKCAPKSLQVVGNVLIGVVMAE
ncbi:MAG: M28 family peptidase [Armatimonadetes bacterium]|nr:M28 family peptidase [Armatimonadota bacterium]